jgi:chromosome segregation ATPase
MRSRRGGESLEGLREAFAALQAEHRALQIDIRAMRRDLDDLDDTVRRLRGRKVKQEALDGNSTLPTKPTIAQLRAVGRLPWG